MNRKPWTEREIAYLRMHYHRGGIGAKAIAEHLGRKTHQVHAAARRYGIGTPQNWWLSDARILGFIARHHALEYSDSEITAAWMEDHPDMPIDRRTVCWLRRTRNKLPANGRTDRLRRRVAEKTREQIKQAGVANLGEFRRRRYRQFARERGWPEGLRPRQVQILDALYDHGPQTRRQLMERLAMNVQKCPKNWFASKQCRGGSYLADLMHRGLVVKLGRVYLTKRKWVAVYAAGPHLTRGEVSCPIESPTANSSPPRPRNGVTL